MKKLMWIMSMLSFVGTAVVLQFMPSSIPMHYNMEGEVDRWGSKYESLIFPIIILITTLVVHLFIVYYEKKSERTIDEYESAKAEANVKVMKIMGVSMTGIFIALQGFILYGAYKDAVTNATHSNIDVVKISCILCGMLFIVLGNYLPKTRKNQMMGVRTQWSMYNDTTWRKCNKFGAITMVLIGFLVILTTAFAETMMAFVLMMVYLTVDIGLIVVYSYKVYKEEVKKVGDEKC